MQGLVKNIVWVLVIILLSLPVSFMVTILLFPFWSWLEASSGIESVGHSGPAEWCYWGVYFLMVSGMVIVFFRYRKTPLGDK